MESFEEFLKAYRLQSNYEVALLKTKKEIIETNKSIGV